MFRPVLIFVLIASFCSLVTAKPADNVKISKHPVVIIISFDGLRHDYFENTTRTPWLNILKRSGIKVPYMDPVFPTSTFPNHQSIATGTLPEIHGVIDNSFFDPVFNRSMTGFEEDPEYWNYDHQVKPLWVLNEEAGDERYSGCYMWPGCSVGYGASNKMPTFNVTPYYNESVPWSERVDTVISWITNETTPVNLVFMYFSQPDNMGHGNGPYSNKTLLEIDNTDSRVAYLVGRLVEYGLYDHINLIFLSDHGMEEVVRERVIPFVEIMNKTELIEEIYGSTPVLHVQSKPGLVDEAFREIQALCQSYACNVTNNAESSSPFYTRRNRRMGDLLVVAQPGYVFDDYSSFQESDNCTTNSTKAGYLLTDLPGIQCENATINVTTNITAPVAYGVHGYINTASCMKPFFVAHGPVFKKGVEVEPFRNIDIFPLISEILGLPNAPSNGSFNNVAGMLISTPGTARGKDNTGGSSSNALISNSFLSLATLCIIIFKLHR